MIAVVGATGAQGGGLVRAILGNPAGGFSPRALTRDARAPTARRLSASGADVVTADLDDASSVRRAFAGAFAAFCVTNYWEHFSPEREVAQARVMAAAAMHAGVQHLIWSTLEDTRRWMAPDDDRMPTILGKVIASRPSSPRRGPMPKWIRLTRALGEAVHYHAVSPATDRTLGFRGAADLANMFQFKRDFHESFCVARDVALSRQLNPSLQTFEQWLGQHKTQIPRD